VRVRLDNPDRLLASGMFVTGELVFDTYRALTLPDDAIISEGDATYVFTVADGRARRTSVEIGQSEDGRTEIADGLERGARVVVTGWDMLSDGAPVTVAGEGPPVEALD
jgi:membrane fusion protein (multidrug efflux system)